MLEGPTRLYQGLGNFRAGDVLFEAGFSVASIVTGEVLFGRQTTENALGQDYPGPIPQSIGALNFHE